MKSIERVSKIQASPKNTRHISTQLIYSPSDDNSNINIGSFRSSEHKARPSNDVLQMNSFQPDKDIETAQSRQSAQKSLTGSNVKPSTEDRKGRNTQAKQKSQTQQELINIRVNQQSSSVKKKGCKHPHGNGNQAIDTEGSHGLEIWKESTAGQATTATQNSKRKKSPKKIEVEKSDHSCVDSDVADEIEYKFDPNYEEFCRRRFFSPQKLKQIQLRDSDRNLLGVSRSYNGFGNEMSQYALGGNDLLHSACMQISHVKIPDEKQKHFVSRMEFDVSKRESRDKTLENLKESLIKKQMSPQSNNSLLNIFPQNSINSSRMVPILKEESPLKFEIDQDTLPLSPGREKRLTQTECDELYHRFKQHDERKKKAIQIMQDEVKRQEDYEMNEKSVNNKFKVNPQQKQVACDRLAKDAERRREKMNQKRQEKLMQEENECKELFKPRINKKYQVKREQILYHSKSSKYEAFNGQPDLQSKLERFQAEAHVNNGLARQSLSGHQNNFDQQSSRYESNKYSTNQKTQQILNIDVELQQKQEEVNRSDDHIEYANIQNHDNQNNHQQLNTQGFDRDYEHDDEETIERHDEQNLDDMIDNMEIQMNQNNSQTV